MKSHNIISSESTGLRFGQVFFGAAANAADLLDLLQKQPAFRRITLGAVNLTRGIGKPR